MGGISGDVQGLIHFDPPPAPVAVVAVRIGAQAVEEEPPLPERAPGACKLFLLKVRRRGRSCGDGSTDAEWLEAYPKECTVSSVFDQLVQCNDVRRCAVSRCGASRATIDTRNKNAAVLRNPAKAEFHLTGQRTCGRCQPIPLANPYRSHHQWATRKLG